MFGCCKINRKTPDYAGMIKNVSYSFPSSGSQFSSNLGVCWRFQRGKDGGLCVLMSDSLSQTWLTWEPTLNISAAPPASWFCGCRGDVTEKPPTVKLLVRVLFSFSSDCLFGLKFWTLGEHEVVFAGARFCGPPRPGPAMICNADRTTWAVFQGRAVLHAVFVLCLLSQRCVKSGSQVGPLCPPQANEKWQTPASHHR